MKWCEYERIGCNAITDIDGGTGQSPLVPDGSNDLVYARLEQINEVFPGKEGFESRNTGDRKKGRTLE